MPKKRKRKNESSKTKEEKKNVVYQVMCDHNPELTIKLRNQSKKSNEIDKADDAEHK